MDLLDRQVAVVTGAGRGIGRAVALHFAEAGAAVALAARTKHEIQGVAEEIKARGRRAIAVVTDVTCGSAIDALMAQTREQLGPVDVLVNNAAVLGPAGKLWQTDLNDWETVFHVNLIGLVRCSMAVLPEMVERGHGKIINVGSVAGWSDRWVSENHELAAYATTKAAVGHFSVCLAQQVKSDGINVNCVGVSAHTQLSEEANQQVAAARGMPPPPTWADLPPEEHVQAEKNTPVFVFLASSLSDHLTGQYLEANRMPARMSKDNRKG